MYTEVYSDEQKCWFKLLYFSTFYNIYFIHLNIIILLHMSFLNHIYIVLDII